MAEYLTQILMQKFQTNPDLSKEEEECQLAKSFNVSEEGIRIWFARRCLDRKAEELLPNGEPVFSNIKVLLDVHNTLIKNFTCIVTILPEVV